MQLMRGDLPALDARLNALSAEFDIPSEEGKDRNSKLSQPLSGINPHSTREGSKSDKSAQGSVSRSSTSQGSTSQAHELEPQTSSSTSSSKAPQRRSFQAHYSVLMPLIIPVAVFGQTAVLLCNLLFGTPISSLIVYFFCLGGVLISAMIAARYEADAARRLGQPENRTQLTADLVLFRNIISEANHLLQQAEKRTAEAVHARATVEARFKVQKRHVRRLEMALDDIEQPVVVTDVNGHALYQNESARSLYKQISQKLAREIQEQTGLIDILEGMRPLLQETLTRRVASDRRTADIPCLATTYRIHAHTLKENENTLLGAALVLQDIGREVQDRSRHAEFVSSVCHEFKTPMSSIKAYAELLRDGEIDEAEEQQKILVFIDEQVDRLSRLVDNMLNLARIESGVIRVQRKDVEINRLLKSALDVVTPQATAKSQTVESLLSDLYIPAHVDEDLFSQAVVNLLSNAVKYTPVGGKISLKSRLEEDRVLIEVRDTGMGIPAASLPRLFERFYRVPENMKAAAGTGLGLALVKYIISSIHDGSITVSSKQGEGSCFTISIPAGHRIRKTHRVNDHVPLDN
jgi:two-component system phosphate regulon sensor histidine kinase PhoR